MIYYKINKLTSSAIAGYRNGNQVVIYNAKDGARHIKGNAEAYSKPSYSLKGACGYRRSLCSTRPRKVSPLFGSVYNPYAGINKAFPRKVFQRGGLAGVHDGRNGEATRVAPRKRNGTYNLTGINGPLYDPRWDGRHKWPSVGQDYDVFLRQGDWFTETKSGNQYQVKGFTTDNLPYYEDENGTYHVVEKENRLPEVFVVRRRRTPADDLDKFFVGMMAAPLAAYGAAELAGLGIGAGSVLESSLASQVAANAPTTTSFLLNGVRGLAAMEAGNEFGNMYARATSPYNTWGEGVAATTGMPRLLADFTNPFALASPWVFEKGAKALYNAGERAVGEGWNLLSRQGNSYARARQLSNAMNNNVKGARLSVGEPRGGTAGYYTPTTKESPATISWENAISSDNNMGSSSLLQRDNEWRYAMRNPFSKKSVNVPELTDDYIEKSLEDAERYKFSDGYRSLVQRAMKESEDLGFGYFPEETFIGKRYERPSITFNKDNSGTLASYSKHTNTVNVDLEQSKGTDASFHEFLHWQRVGEPDLNIGPRKEKWSEAVLNGEPDAVTHSLYKNTMDSSMESMRWDWSDNVEKYMQHKTNKVLDPSTPTDSPLRKPYELHEHTQEAGHALGIEEFAPYPGYKKAVKTIKKAIEYDSFLRHIKHSTEEEVKDFWKLLTGNYMPVIVGGTVFTGVSLKE